MLSVLPQLSAKAQDPAAASDWPQAQRDPQRRGYTDDRARPPFKPLWSIHFGYERIARCVSTIVYGGRVFVGTKAGTMRALNLADGKEVWSAQAGGPILHTAAAGDGKAVFASLDGKLYALDVGRGRSAWTFDSGFGFSNAPLLAENSILIGNREGAFFRVNLADGKKIWSVDLGAPLFQTASFNDGKVYVGTEDMVMHALSVADGKEVWKSDKLQGQSFKDYWPLVHKGYVIVRPMVVAMEWMKVRDGFPPFGWGTDKKLLEDALKAWPEGRPLPEPFMKAQDGLARWYTDHPAYQEIYFLRESDGKIGFVPPLVRMGALGGPVPPPSVMKNGLLPVPLMCDAARWGAFDVDRQRIVDLWPVRQGNPDETHITTQSGSWVILQHCREGWAAGAFDPQTRAFHRFPNHPGPRSPFWDNLVNGVSPGVVSGKIILHIYCSTVLAWEGQGE